MTNHEKRIYALEQNLLKMLRVIEVMQKHQVTLGNAIQDLQSAVQQIASAPAIQCDVNLASNGAEECH